MKPIVQLIINKSIDNNIHLNITKLHKLLYIVYGFYYSITNNTLFDELPLCLPYGPVFETLYYDYRSQSLILEKNDIICNDDQLDDIITQVVQKYGKYETEALADWTHRSGSACDMIENKSSHWGSKIPLKLIKNEFDLLLINQ